MKYVVVDEPKNGIGEYWTNEFESKEEAIKRAEIDWSYLTSYEKAKRSIYVLESANPDEDAEDHFDGNPVWTPEEK